jgi:hypothetical protein
MSFLVDEFVGTSYMTTTIAGGGALRWAAPELVPTWEGTNFQPVKGYKSDIYSLGGVLYHVSDFSWRWCCSVDSISLAGLLGTCPIP